MDFMPRMKKATKAKETQKLYGSYSTKHIRAVEKLLTKNITKKH